MKCGATLSPDGVVSCLEEYGHTGWHRNGHDKWNYDVRAEKGKAHAEASLFQGVAQSPERDEEAVRGEKGNERLLREGEQVREEGPEQRGES